MVRYATIGTSWITDAFIQGAKLVDGFRLQAVYSRDYEKGEAFAQKYGVTEIFTDLHALAQSAEIDAVYIASPNILHYSQSKLFLQHGKHVFCEKPITVTAAELQELQQLAAEKGLVYQEAMMMAHLPQRKILKHALTKIGHIYTAHFDFSQLSSKYQSFLDGNLPNIFRPEMAAGCLMDLGIYCVYPAIDLFGVPDEIIATAGFLSTGADGYGSSIFRYSDKEVHISYSKVGQSRLGSQILGDEGTIVLPSISQLTGMRLIHKDGTEQPLWGEEEKHILMGAEAQNFYRMITTPNEYHAEQQELSALAYQVSQVMQTIRAKAGIHFHL